MAPLSSTSVRSASGSTAKSRPSRFPAPVAPEKIPNSSIRVLRTVAALRAHTAPLTRDHRTLSLVPTMGALHAGHLALIRAAALASHNVIVSLYVNPAQFGPKEDLASYPRTWDADAAALARLSRSLADDPDVLGKISAVFAPSTEELYPGGFPGQDIDSPGSFVTITPLAARLEGSSRPTFFRGVATVDYISLTDPDTMEDIVAIDPARGAILCGAVKMLPVEAPKEGEDLGLSGGPAVRLIDNIILPPKAS
ncbi:hypothetical protein VdG1_08564 [Verticillium dahliae VDG1]|nr:hypothetical protein VdG1_08564 [Verticillium dahliae VDG1]